MIPLVLAACSSKTLDARNAEVVNGKLYQRGENSPFSGAVTNVANGLVFSASPGFEQVSNTVGKAILYSEQISSYDSTTMGNVQQYMTAIGMHPLVTNSDTAGVLCDVRVREGLLDGAVKCKTARSEDVVLEAAMSGGQLNGKLTAYRYENGTQHVALTAGFKDGRLDGKEEIYSRHGDKLIHRIAWSNGVADGTEEAFDDRTGKRVMQVNNVDGKNDGEYVEYAPDGERAIHRLKVENGVPVGVEETFDPKSGKLTGQAQYVNGKLHGTVKRWNASGKLIYEREFQNGEMLRPDDAVAECASNRAQAYEQATGQHEDPAQRDEWDASCRELLRIASNSATQGAK
jgi:antitoxin component YwqK of YwqJK toxin-antitoxin module